MPLQQQNVNSRLTENRSVFATHGFNTGRIVGLFQLFQQHAMPFAIKTTHRSLGPKTCVQQN